MVAAALIVLVWLDRAESYLAIIIIGREIAISALREWMAELGQRKSVAVAFVGKLKTVAQMTAIVALLLYEPLIPGVPTPRDRHRRAVDRGDPHALVDVPLSAARGAPPARLPQLRRANRRSLAGLTQSAPTASSRLPLCRAPNTAISAGGTGRL